MSDSLKEEALRYHRFPTAGKVSVTPTKALDNQRDLSLAYSPGVAFACQAIEADPLQADFLTSRANLVAVISNGSAVLGLGNIGALAGKPVMEGKGVLFKKFAGIDVFDIEVDQDDPEKFIEAVAALEPTFGGINLEDIKAPECFEIENRLKERMNIPVFHDDQHGTAIIASAALINALRLQDKDIAQVRVVASGAGAAGMACLDMFVNLGVKKEHIIVCDSKGPIYEGRPGKLDGRKAEFVAKTEARSLAEALSGADVFLGVSQAGLLTGEMVQTMAAKPLVLALANPVPEIMPEEVHKVRDDAIVATGRSDYPNQVNNVLCFPYLFRGALDVGATTINEAMKMAAVYAIADLAQSPAGEEVMAAYGGQALVYGKDYVIPKPFDPRLISTIPVAGAKAAMESGVVPAMRQAGIKPGEEVALYGHSQGGITVSNIAADPAIQGRYNITTVLTAGSPTAGADIPDDVHALHLENTGDAVPGLDAAPTPTGPHRQVAMLDTHQTSTNGYPHASSAYAQAAEGLEDKAPELADWNKSFSRASGAGEQGTTTTEYTFAVQRNTDPNGIYKGGATYRGKVPSAQPSYPRPTPSPQSTGEH